jgi:DNA mismatch repair ATPase MutS
MKVLLMHPDRDFDLQQKLPRNEAALTQDLELNTLLQAMAGGDQFLLDIARKALLSALSNDSNTILYRQEILKDCLRNHTIVRELYGLVLQAIENRRQHWWGITSRYPTSVLHSSVELMEMFVGMLRKLRDIADEHADGFQSTGFRSFFAMLKKELEDGYLASVQNHLKELQFRRGVLISAGLGSSNEGINYVLRKTNGKSQSWLDRIRGKGPPSYTFHIDDRDEAGAKALGELRDQGINLVANALAQSVDHILNFFNLLRAELAFYVACLNLHARVASKTLPICFPKPGAAGKRAHDFHGLYDVCLALSMETRVVGNEINADGKSLVIITGANQGGKSSFLRSIGLAQLMMQCGLFVAAEAFAAEISPGIFTHYKREEDATMMSGKFDEELARMSEIVDLLVPNSILLCNESFAATNDREGSEIAKQIVSALLENQIKVFYVTHLYEFARGFFDRKGDGAIFLRAERKPDGTRTFRLIEAKPLETSYGEDLYRHVFADDFKKVSSVGGVHDPEIGLIG